LFCFDIHFIVGFRLGGIWLRRKIAAPFVPQIKSELDVSNFSEDFTSMAVADSPAIIPAAG
jgi:hypothetical protein